LLFDGKASVYVIDAQLFISLHLQIDNVTFGKLSIHTTQIIFHIKSRPLKEQATAIVSNHCYLVSFSTQEIFEFDEVTVQQCTNEG